MGLRFARLVGLRRGSPNPRRVRNCSAAAVERLSIDPSRRSILARPWRVSRARAAARARCPPARASAARTIAALELLARRLERARRGRRRTAATCGGSVDGADPAAPRRVHRERGDDVLQLADVARPVVAAERRQRLRRQRRARADAGGRVAPEVRRQQPGCRSPARAAAARRCGSTSRRKRRSARKRPARDLLLEAAVGGGDDPHVDAPRQVLADPAHFALLQHAQQLGLGARRQLADLVEEQRAAVRLLEQARPARPSRR